ncbi:hypothetical protein H6770_03050 [Candidatus Peribacteria bacterium]|nr:hypothetical protein [Candidatus Peribacteria bacterium]
MQGDTTAPATKADMQQLMDHIDETIAVLHDDMQLWKDALQKDTEQWRDEVHQDTEKWKEEIKADFYIAVGQIRHDLIGANRDEISVLQDARQDHERRIATLESRV